MPTKVKTKALRATVREGEVQGTYAIALRGHPSDHLKTDSEGNVLIDITNLGVPQDWYDADVAWIEKRFGTVSLFFAKASVNDHSTLRSRIEVRYPPESFCTNFWRNSRKFQEGLEEVTDPAVIVGAQPEQFNPQKLPALKDHSLWVNFELISRAGNEATIDFFHLPAPMVAQYAKTKDLSKMRFSAVVRVILTTDELLKLLRSAAPIAAELEPLFVKVDEVEEEDRRERQS